MCEDYHCASNPLNSVHGSADPAVSSVVPVAAGSVEYSNIKEYLLSTWLHTQRKRKPRLHAIYKILLPDEKLRTFMNYRDALHRTVGENGNERLLFHGTVTACALGQPSKKAIVSDTTLCQLSACYLCRIIAKGSYDMKLCGARHDFRRFGNGIYVSPCSSKADDYASNERKLRGMHLLLLNRVLLGNSYELYQNETDRTSAPIGYHSIHGKSGQDLNYDEMVVYNEHAIRPAYVLVYEVPRESFIRGLLRTPLIQ